MTTATKVTIDACDDCLRRSDLIAALVGPIDIQWRRSNGPKRVLALTDAELLELDRDGRGRRRYRSFSPAAQRDTIRAGSLSALCSCSSRYPARLNDLHDPPAVVYCAGRLDALERAPCAAVVGARRGSSYGIEVSKALGRALSAAQIPVISGMALGVDSAAHTGALENETPTISVLAGGVDIPYPASKTQLYRAIIRRGCAISELPPQTRSHRWCFIARNRIIAALSEVTIVIEAAQRSGALTTADFAIELGRTVGAVPGQITSRFSAGTNDLLANGAVVIRSACDVLDVLFGVGCQSTCEPLTTSSSASLNERHRAAHPSDQVAQVGNQLAPPLQAIIDAIDDGKSTLSALSNNETPSDETLAALTELELLGLIRRTFSGNYIRTLEF